MSGSTDSPSSNKYKWLKYTAAVITAVSGLVGLFMMKPGGAASSADPSVNVQGSNNHIELHNDSHDKVSNSDSHNDSHDTNTNSHNVDSHDVINNINLSPEAVKALKQSTDALQPHPRAKPFPLEDYIDRRVQRVGGSLNVAVVVQGAPNSAALLDAIHRALIDREMSVVPLFRDKFRQDGTAGRLFGGDAALASNLKLRDYVDSVLLAEFRFAGPAQAVQGNLYIREAILEVHAIDPASGEVRKVLQIREKGGGATAEQCSDNALTRLEQSIENDISGWVWV